MLQIIIEDDLSLIFMSKKNFLKKKEAVLFEKIKIARDSLTHLKNENFASFINSSKDEETTLSNSNLSQPNIEYSKIEKKISSVKITGYSKIQELKLVKIGLASGDKILEWSEKILPNGKIFGEVLNANTLHYKTFKPHKGGLFCERIFGPLKDFECACGVKQKSFNDQDSIRNLVENKTLKRLFCPVCDVEYTWSVIRRYQLGYIKLASPVSHLWYLRTNPSYLSVLLDIKKRDVEAIVYCTQVTTLEYYWKPVNSLQLNLNASNLIESYQSFKKYKFGMQKFKNSQDLLQSKTRKKQKIELKRRQSLKMVRQDFSFIAKNKNSKHLRLLENESLETKKEYLEKSFQLSSADINNKALNTLSRVNNYLRKKVSKNSKKKSFLMISSEINKRFYEEMFFLIGRKSLFISLGIEDSRNFFDVSYSTKTKNLNPLPIFSKKLCYLSSVLKPSLIRNLERKKARSRQQNCEDNLQLLTSEFFWIAKNRYISISKVRDTQKKLDFKNNPFYSLKLKESFGKNHLGSARSLLAISNLLGFLRNAESQLHWDSIYNNLKSSIQFISLNTEIFSQKIFKERILSFKDQKFHEKVQSLFFLYFLSVIQQNRESFLKKTPVKIFKEILIVQTLLVESFNVNSSFGLVEPFLSSLNSSRKHPEIDFLSKFLQTNYFFQNHKRSFRFVEVEEIFVQSKNHFLLYLKFLMKFVEPCLFRLCRISLLKRYRKSTRKDFLIVFQSTSKKNLKSDYQNTIFSKFLNGQNNSEKEMESLFQSLIQQKKFSMSLKCHPETISDFNKSIKTLNHFLQKLSLSKDRFGRDSTLKNNIYTVAYSNGWSTEKDWRYFLYYNIAPIDMIDQTLSFYKNRFNPELNLNKNFLNAPPIIGANLIQKLLFQYEGEEIRKMVKQNQSLLPKLNRYIRYLKEMATKKSEFSAIQKLLQKRDLIIRRLKLLRKFVKKNVIPSSTILTILPVLPPDLRPILKMQNQIAASDLNRFYQRIIYRNERLKKFLKANASTLNIEPGFEIKYAQRLLQEAVDNLIQNGKGQVKPETNSKGQPLKSLSEILKGKQGRFRQYLLGKRVDYSGRSVIVVGPTLKIYQCGLPFEMALELFLPFLIKRIFKYRLARTVVGAKTILKTQKKMTWNLLEEIMEDHPILLNRAPTLHRLGIQAFQPKLIEGRAILLHPLVCPAFNADFDGDQMAVHLPITVEARTEAWKLMLSRNQLISPATGDPMLLPSQDMVLGCYYLTTEALQIIRFNKHRPFVSGTGFYFSNLDQVLAAYQAARIHLQTPIWLKWNGLVEMEQSVSSPFEIRLESKGSWKELRSKLQRNFNQKGVCETTFLRTTAGRVLFNTVVENCIQNSFPSKVFSN